MNPERFRRLKALLVAASTLPLDERDAYLATARGDDPELRAEAERILAHAKDRDGILRTGERGPALMRGREAAT